MLMGPKERSPPGPKNGVRESRKWKLDSETCNLSWRKEVCRCSSGNKNATVVLQFAGFSPGGGKKENCGALSRGKKAHLKIHFKVFSEGARGRAGLLRTKHGFYFCFFSRMHRFCESIRAGGKPLGKK